MILALLCWFAAPVYADGGTTDFSRSSSSVLKAEHMRLSEEIRNLSRRQVWLGVERKFSQLEELGTGMTYRDYLFGAHAARALGNVSAAYERLKSAAQIDPSKEVIDWLYDIDTKYSQVELSSVGRGSPDLKVDVMPMDPIQRTAIEAATYALEMDGAFVGVLPHGEYSFNGQSFIVSAGEIIKLQAENLKKRGDQARLRR